MNQDKLIAKRIEFGLTQSDMAEVLGISVAGYNLKENGYRRFNQSEMVLIFKKFKSLNPEINMQDIFLS